MFAFELRLTFAGVTAHFNDPSGPTPAGGGACSPYLEKAMRNMNHVLAALVREYGIEVDKGERGDLQLWWAAFSQGDGVTFNGEFVDFSGVVKEMFTAGHLHLAAEAKKHFDAEDISVTITRTDHRYTHSQTMDVDVSELDEPKEEMTDAVREAAKSVKDEASSEAYSLLEDYLMLEISKDTVFKTFATRHFKVELIKVKDQEWAGCCLDTELECYSPEEGLDFVRQVTKTYNEYEAYGFSVVVSGRDDRDDEWEQITSEQVVGGVYPAASKFVNSIWRDLAREAIAGARKHLGLNKTLKEAA